jgi:hypothetical protein
MTKITSSRTLTRLFAAVALADLAGLIVAVSGGLNDLGTAIVSGTYVNAPAPFVAVQALIVLAAVRATRWRAVCASALLAVACGVSVASGFSDGSYGADLTALQETVQTVLVGLTLALGLAAAARTVASLRPSPVAA